MPRALLINTCSHLSTGAAMCRDARAYERDGYETTVAFSIGPSPEDIPFKRIGGKANRLAHAVCTRLLGRTGSYSRGATRRFVEWARDWRPDVVHLHNLHGYYINLDMLFDFLANEPCREVVWTLHDCWPFTGQCAYFSHAGCNKWEPQTGCDDTCPQLGSYPKTLCRSSCKRSYNWKRELFTSVGNMRIVTPSQWLANTVRRSFLGGYPVEVVPNQIDTDVFKPTQSDVRRRLGIADDVRMVLGVASTWEPRKGLDYLYQVASQLGDGWKVVVVGLSKQQIQHAPRGVLALGRASSKEELACLYSAADVFFNPTFDDNYPTVNLEAQACGTPLLAFDVGGNRETVTRADSVILDTRDVERVVDALQKMMGRSGCE